MAAHEDLKNLYLEAIEPAVLGNGLDPFLMTVREPEGTINSAILDHIESARLIVADLTHERPNCYYEVGYAHAKGVQVLLTAREDHDPRRPHREIEDPKVHFDLDTRRISFWSDGGWVALQQELRTRIKESVLQSSKWQTRSSRIGSEGRSFVLNSMKELQAAGPSAITFGTQFLAQELGWPVEDTGYVLEELVKAGKVDRISQSEFRLTPI